jgi:hypothetical protein
LIHLANGFIIHLCGFLRLQMSVASQYNWAWKAQGTDAWEALFSTGTHAYSVTFERCGQYWEVGFSSDNHEWPLAIGITGSGNAFKVFATVIDTLRAFVAQQRNVTLCFTADENSRQSLYKKFISKITDPSLQSSTYDEEQRVFCLVFKHE